MSALKVSTVKICLYGGLLSSEYARKVPPEIHQKLFLMGFNSILQNAKNLESYVELLYTTRRELTKDLLDTIEEFMTTMWPESIKVSCARHVDGFDMIVDIDYLASTSEGFLKTSPDFEKPELAPQTGFVTMWLNINLRKSSLEALVHLRQSLDTVMFRLLYEPVYQSNGDMMMRVGYKYDGPEELRPPQSVIVNKVTELLSSRGFAQVDVNGIDSDLHLSYILIASPVTT